VRVTDIAKSHHDIASTQCFVKDVLFVDKVETSLQETWESVEAQEDFNDSKETEGLIVNNTETVTICTISSTIFLFQTMQCCICVAKKEKNNVPV
jgi:hypothetical protein